MGVGVGVGRGVKQSTSRELSGGFLEYISLS